mgnify:CR=1 FL=1
MRRERKAGDMPTEKSDKTATDLAAVLEKIEEFPEPYAQIGKDLQETILNSGPKLNPHLWYGMPGYAKGRSTPVLVFFRCDDGVFTLGLSEKANVESEPDTTLRPCAWFLDKVDEITLEKVAELVRIATD